MFKFTRNLKPKYGLDMRMNSLRDLLFNCYFCKVGKETYVNVLSDAIKTFNEFGVSVTTEQIGVDDIEVVFSAQYDSNSYILKKVTSKTLENYAPNLSKYVKLTEDNIANSFEMVNTLQTINYSESDLYKKLNSFFHEDEYSFKMRKLTNLLNTFVDDSCTIHVNEVTTSIIVEAYSATVHRKTCLYL